MSRLGQWSPYALAALRIVAALLFVEHATVKFFAFPTAMSGSGGALPPIIVVAGLIELIGGSLIALGLFTRPAAFVASGMSAAAYFIGHASRSFWPAINQGEAAIMFCFIFLYLACAGPGAWSIDGMRRRG